MFCRQIVKLFFNPVSFYANVSPTLLNFVSGFMKDSMRPLD